MTICTGYTLTVVQTENGVKYTAIVPAPLEQALLDAARRMRVLGVKGPARIVLEPQTS